MHGAIPPLPKFVFMVWGLVKHRDNFILPLLIDLEVFYDGRAAERMHTGHCYIHICLFVSMKEPYFTACILWS